MAVNKNVLRYYIRSDGTYFPASEDVSKIYPGSAYANLLDIYLEDGISENTFVQVSFLIDGKFVTEWLPTFNQGTETRVIEGVSVPFGVFRIAIPPNVTQNASPTATKQVGISVRQVYGEAWQGVYEDYGTLVEDVKPTETLANDYATAYCLNADGDDVYGFYQCQADGETYIWVAVTIANTYQEIKTYGVGEATLQKGWVSPKGTVTISNVTEMALLLEVSNLTQRIIAVETAVDDLDLDKLEKDFGEYDPKTTFNGTDTIAINDSEDGGDPKEMALSDLMEAENMSFDNSATALDDDNVQDAIESVQTNVETVQSNLTAHEDDETNPHNTTASITPFTPTDDISSDNVQEAVEEIRALFTDIPLDNLYDFGERSTPIEYLLYLLATEAPARALFHGRWYDEHIFGTSQQYGGGVVHATFITPTEVVVYEYNATSGPLGTITKTTSFSTIVSGDTIVGKAEKDASGNVITTTYETKADATTHKARTTALETFKDVTVPATYATKTENNAKVSKVLTGYSGVSSPSDSQRLYIDDSGTPKYTTVGSLKTHIASDFVSFGYVIASADGDGLPDVAEPLTNKIYLILISEPDEDNIYNEFLYVDGSWELFGTTEMDLSAENITYNESNIQTELDDINSALLTLLGE